MLRSWHFTGDGWFDAAMAVVSELATNAVRHSGGAWRWNMHAHQDHVALGAADGSADVPCGRDADPDADGGCGIGIIEAFWTRGAWTLIRVASGSRRSFTLTHGPGATGPGSHR